MSDTEGTMRKGTNLPLRKKGLDNVGSVGHALDNEKQNTEQLFTWWTPSFLCHSSQ